MRGRRRKPRVQWLPVPGTLLKNTAAGTPLDPVTLNPGVVEFKFQPQVDQAVVINAPLVVDQPVDELFTGGASLVAWQGQALNESQQWGYRLRRIVGDFYCTAHNGNDQNQSFPAILLQAGIMVRRVDEATGLMVSDGNVGSIQNIADPWVWRRSYVLGPTSVAPHLASLEILDNFPASNDKYGTKWHSAVDQKTARVIGPEERLFLSVTAWCLPLNKTQFGSGDINDSGVDIYFIFDYRVLATLRLNAGNRRNASR